MGRGIFCISIDLELLWGVHDVDYRKHAASVSKVRVIVKRLLTLFEKYDVGATWAAVGHLYLSSCKPVHGVKHPEIVRPKYSWFTDDWFAPDPATNIKHDPLWYGEDIIDLIRKHKKQELASHSFSHIIFGDTGCSRRAAESDIKMAVKLAAKKRVKLSSFVFPRNSEGYHEVLTKQGFKAFRGDDPYWYKGTGGMYKPLMLVDMLLLRTPPCSRPTRHSSGLLNIPGSMLFVSRDGFRKRIPMACRTQRAKKGIDRANNTGTVFHLWFHPMNFSSDTEEMFKGLEEVLAYAKKQKIQVKTMQEITHDHSM